LLGRHLVPQLLARGDEVIALSRRARLPWVEGSDVEVRQGDLREPKSIAAAVKGCDAVIHAAAELFDRQQMRATNVNGMANLLEALSGHVAHLVMISSVGVIGPGRGRISEDTACHPTSEYEATKLEAEQLALEFSHRSGMPVTVVRPTNVFGEREATGHPDSFAALLRAIESRRFVYFGRGAVANYVYAGDVADACITTGVRSVRGIVHVNDPCPLEEFIAAASDALAVSRPSFRIPKSVAYVAAAVLQLAGALTGRRPPLTVNRVRALTSETIYVSDRIPNELAWRPRYGHREGLRRTVAHYRRIGSLP